MQSPTVTQYDRQPALQQLLADDLAGANTDALPAPTPVPTTSKAPSASTAATTSIHHQLMFYRTSYKLSEQQLTLPRGIYVLQPGESLTVQLYFAVHPVDWDSDQYVSARAATAQALAMQDTQDVPSAASPDAAAPGAGDAAPGSCSEGTPSQQGSCSPCARSVTMQPCCSHDTAGLATLAGAAAASELLDAQLLVRHTPEPQQLEDVLQPQDLLWSEEAAASWAEGFAPGSTLLGPFPALAKANMGPREGLCRLSKVQHNGQLKGIWHTKNHCVVLYEKVGLTLILHIKPRQPEDERKTRRPAKMFSLPGKGYGRQIYAGSVTEVDTHSKLVTSKTGSIPLKLPKALVLSQFKVDTLPIVVPVDVVVDGQPAELTMQIQGSDSTSCIRVQREAKISQLPRHQSYCLSGLVTAGLGPYTGHYVTKVSAPGGQRIVLHLSSPAVVAAADAARKGAAAAKAEGEAAAGAVGAAATGEGSDSETEDGMDCTAGAADAVSADDTAAGGSGSVSPLPAVAHAGDAGPIAAADDVAVLQVMQGQHSGGDDVAQQQQQQPGCHAVIDSAAAAADGEGRQADATLHHRTFWLQRLTRCKQTSLLPVVAEALAAASGAGGAPGDQVQQDESAPAAAAEAAAAADTHIPAVAPIVVKVPASSAGSSRLSMFKAILQRQRQQQQQHKGQGTSATSSGDACRGDESPNCSSGSSSFTSCGSDVCTARSSPVAASMQAAAYPCLGERLAAAPNTEAHAATAAALTAAAARTEVVDSVSLHQEQAAAFRTSRKRVGVQTSRLGHLCGSAVESPHIQDWGAAHAAAHIRSKRQKTAAAM